MRKVSYKIWVNGAVALETASYQQMLKFEAEHKAQGHKVWHEQILTDCPAGI